MSFKEFPKKAVERALRSHGMKPEGHDRRGVALWGDGKNVVRGPAAARKTVPARSLYSMGETLEGHGIVSRRDFVQRVKDEASGAQARAEKAAVGRTALPEIERPSQTILEPVRRPAASASSKELRHPAVGTVRVSIRNIQPQEAALILKGHEASGAKQRKIKRTQVDLLVHVLQERQWVFNGQSISIGENGALVNGLHRLTACMRAGLPLLTLFVEDVPASGLAFDTSDQGPKRSIADVLGVHGHADRKILSAVVRIIFLYENRDWSWNSVGFSGTRPMSTLDALAIVDKHKMVKESLRYGRGCAIASPSIIAAMHYLCSLRDHELADMFFESLVTGENVQHGEPLQLLRRRLERDRELLKRDRARQLYLITRAWNATRSGESLATIPLPRDRHGSLPSIK